MDRVPALRERIHPFYVEVPGWAKRFKSGGDDRHLVHYFAWQAAARREGERLHREIGFDLAHHMTWAVAWLPAGVSRIKGLPFVWGPVSGAGRVPRSLWRWLGFRGAVQEATRGVALPAARWIFGRRPLRKASIVLSQSPELARWASRRTDVPVHVEPLAGIRPADLPKAEASPPANDGGKRAVFAARMLPWKGLRASVAALASPEVSDWTLDVFGAGPEIEPARRLAAKLELGDRVRFRGVVDRSIVMKAILDADALLNPSIHDSAPFVLAEAISVGCPVVCMDMGGMSVMVPDHHGARVSTSEDVVGGIAGALARIPARFGPSKDWMIGRLPSRIDEWYRKAVETQSAGD
jgi:glycosyltransferase involved in cell wall biosynthesis